jgi:hypothetical protein
MAMKIYQGIVDDGNTSEAEKKSFLDQYAQFAIEWGFLSKAYDILHEKLELEDEDMAEQEATVNRIKEVLDYQNGSLL